ncbi:hypothetical protein WICPIJ_003697 [Wickerhamomyces pijperi]|uniref:Deacetylase sirtuin-type domain-containing protein n=1 Tax=Wickerhamomyces pijperi TaxID=599730 RepID=A0A9P8Q9D2_WICPI|nr:hypothetical protein WICPIJ_003697 [Wickerhamomyces pijperi]
MSPKETKSGVTSPTGSQSSTTSSLIMTEERVIGRNTRSKRKMFDSGFLDSTLGTQKDEVLSDFLTSVADGKTKKRTKMEVNDRFQEQEEQDTEEDSEDLRTITMKNTKETSLSYEGKLEPSPVIIERPKLEISGARKLTLDYTNSILGNLTNSPGKDSGTEMDSNSERESTSSSAATTPLSIVSSTASPNKKSKSKQTTKHYRGKPHLHYRPDNGIVLNLDTYDPEVPILEQDDDIDNADVSFLHYALTYSRRMVVVTGAGISCASGIPDFRSSNGLFKSLKSSSSSSSQNTGSGGSPGRELFTRSVYEDPEKTGEFHAMVNSLHSMSRDSEPSKFHHLINQIGSEGRLLRHYTQNIDCLESKLPHLQTKVPLPHTGPYPATIQLHGSVNSMYCVKCHWEAPYDPSLFTTNEAPHCPTCADTQRQRGEKNLRERSVGRLRPRIVLYEEFHPEGEKIGKVSEQDIRAKPDCLLIVGTTLKIPGVKILVRELARVVSSMGGCVIWVNQDQPKVDVVDYIEWLDLIVTGDCQVLGDVVQNYSRQLKAEGVKRGSRSIHFEEEDHTRSQHVQDIRETRDRKLKDKLGESDPKQSSTKDKFKKETKAAELLTKKRMEKMNEEIKEARLHKSKNLPKLLSGKEDVGDTEGVKQRLKMEVVNIPGSESDEDTLQILEMKNGVFESVFN